jgi:hypothetical protein
MTAFILQRKHGKSTQSWVIGGQWTPGDALQERPKRVSTLIQEHGMNPAQTSRAWVPESRQVGLFEIEHKPRRPRSLAAHLAAILPAGKLPWRGLFNLGPVDGPDGQDVWWMAAIGSTGDVMPEWDRFGTHDEMLAYLAARTPEIAMIPHGENFSTPEESWGFLSQDAPQFIAVPASGASAARGALKIVAPLAVLLVVAAGGATWWQHHRQQALLAQQAAASRLQQEMAQRMTAQRMAQRMAQEQQVRAYWAGLPRPWVSSPSWAQVISACQPGPLSVQGWGLTSVTCTVADSGLQITRAWSRGPVANVDHAPDGAQFSADGNTATTVQIVPLAKDTQGPSPQSVAALQMRWLSLTQRWSGVMGIQAEAAQAFVAPWPPNTSPDVQKALSPPPVLWHTIAIALKPVVTARLIQPADPGNPFNQPDFLPAQVQINMGTVPSITLKGIQYATS